VTAAMLRRAGPDDAQRLADLVAAAYGHYVERMGTEPRPMTYDYAEVVRDFDVTVAELDGQVVGLVALTTDDEGFCCDNVAVDPSTRAPGSGGHSSDMPRARRGTPVLTRSTSSPTS